MPPTHTWILCSVARTGAGPSREPSVRCALDSWNGTGTGVRVCDCLGSPIRPCDDQHRCRHDIVDWVTEILGRLRLVLQWGIRAYVGPLAARHRVDWNLRGSVPSECVAALRVRGHGRQFQPQRRPPPITLSRSAVGPDRLVCRSQARATDTMSGHARLRFRSPHHACSEAPG